MTIRFYKTISTLWQQFFIVAFLCLVSSSALNCTSDPCMYGICLDSTNSSYSCYCIDGYTGIHCEINYDDCWSDPCLNGGTCTDAVAFYNCTCTDGFIGTNCEQKYSECLNQPCLNNGTCIDYNGFTCQCQEGYSGEYCEIDVSVCNSTICKNGGECIDGPGYSFSCNCREGWTGEICEDDIDECLSSPCLNGGLCLNVPATYTCVCLFGFTGRDCDKVIVACETNQCQNDAMCLLEDSQPICYCVPDYHGQLCELRYNDCESKFARCENGGTCIDGINDFTCACPPPYGGEMCLDYVPISVTIPTSRGNTLTSTLPSTIHQELSSSVTPKHFTEWAAQPTPSAYNQTHNVTQKVNVTSTGSPVTFMYDTSSEKLTTSFEFSTHKYSKTTTAFETSTTSVFQIDQTSKITSTPFTNTNETSSSSPTARTPIEMFNETVGSTGIKKTSPTTQKIETTLGSKLAITKSPEDDKTPLLFTTSIVSTTRSFNDTTTLSTSSTNDLTLGTIITTTQKPNGSLATTVYSVEPGVYGDTDNCTSKDCVQPTTPTITNAAFNGKSYVRQQVMIDETGLLKIFLQLKTKSKNGIIMHAFIDEERYVLLYMELGQLKFQFSCGLQTMLLGEIDTPINNGRNIDVEMRFRYLVEDKIGKCSARLFVNNAMAMSGEQMLSANEDIPRIVRLHLGGIPQTFSHYFPRIALGFIGCMSMLKVNDVQRHFIKDSIETFQIEECTSFLCLMNPCRNFGSCHDIDGKVYCKCIAGYTGEICEKTACDDNPCYLGATCISSPGTGFICVCPLGLHGLRCEEESTIVQPSFSVFIPGFSSYAAYGINAGIKDSMELKMRVLAHTTDQISLIAFMGQSGSSGKEVSDHFSVTYVKGYIMLTWDLGSGVRRIFTKNPLPNKGHKPHTIYVGRRGRDAWLAVDGIGNVTGQAAGTMTQLDVSPILYVGGHKSRNFESLPHDLPLHTGFTGCIFEVELRTEKNILPVTRSSPATGRGVGECHRNECTHNTCKNGAVCLNHGPTYSCICMKEWEGPECSISAITCSPTNLSCHKLINV